MLAVGQRLTQRSPLDDAKLPGHGSCSAYLPSRLNQEDNNCEGENYARAATCLSTSQWHCWTICGWQLSALLSTFALGKRLVNNSRHPTTGRRAQQPNGLPLASQFSAESRAQRPVSHILHVIPGRARKFVPDSEQEEIKGNTLCKKVPPLLSPSLE